MKTLALLTLLATTSCAAVAPTMIIQRGSKAANEITGGEAGQTLTERAYQLCKQGDKAACSEGDLYTVAFFVPDRITALMIGRPDLLAAGHGEIWHETEKLLPQVSQKQDNYGGAKYNQFMEK